jgi:alpha-2-macroglobulin
VFITPSLTAAVSPALEYLVGYPYGCSEQTMSRFLPALLASRTLGANELGADTVKKLPEYVKIGVERLEGFQHDDGGWGFWQYDESTLEMTAYVVGGLLRAKALEAKITPGVLERGLKYLSAAANQERQSRADRASAYLTLSIAAQAPLEAMRRFALRDGLEASVLARMAIAFSRANAAQDAGDALDRLKALRQENARGISWRNPNNNREYWWSWDDNPVTTTAVALEAFARVEPKSPLLPKISAWLLAERQGARWVSTRDTAAVIEAALALDEDTKLQPTPVTVLLNGDPIKELTVQGQVKLELANAQAPLKSGKNTLELRAEKRILYSADLEYVREPAQLTGSNKGINVTRQFEKLEAKFNESDGTYTFVPRALLRGGSLEPVTVGEYVLVTLTVSAKEARYLLLSDAIPAGFRALETRTLPLQGQPYRSYWEWTWNYWFSGLDIRDDRVEVYAARLEGKQQIQYLLRAETPGKYTALPTEAFLMYEPTVSGRSSGATLTVRDRGQ